MSNYNYISLLKTSINVIAFIIILVSWVMIAVTLKSGMSLYEYHIVVSATYIELTGLIVLCVGILFSILFPSNKEKTSK
jgi:hypothetical protein